MFFIIEEAKENILDVSKGAVRVLWMLSYDSARRYSTICFNLIQYQYKMMEHNILNVKMSNSRFSKLKPE